MKAPAFLSHLKTCGDYPVPFVQQWVDGKPDFRVIDPEKVEECVRKTLCAICGIKLGEFSWFIGGDKCRYGHQFTDWAMHEQCAEFASATCPFVSGDRSGYSERALPENAVTVPHVSAVRPVMMYRFKTRTKQIRVTETVEGFVFEAGPYQRLVVIHSGGS